MIIFSYSEARPVADANNKTTISLQCYTYFNILQKKGVIRMTGEPSLKLIPKHTRKLLNSYFREGTK